MPRLAFTIPLVPLMEVLNLLPYGTIVYHLRLANIYSCLRIVDGCIWRNGAFENCKLWLSSRKGCSDGASSFRYAF